MDANKIICGENLEVMKGWPDDSVDAIVTDIPYGIGFMGKEWDTFKQENVNQPKSYKMIYKTDFKDGVPVKRKNPERVTRDSGARRAGSYDLSRNAEYQEWCRIWSAEALRIAKPGAFLLCFGGPRTSHRAFCGIEDAGWLIRDKICWVFGSGFPKSLKISLQFEQRLCERRDKEWYYKSTNEKMKRKTPFRHPKANEWAGYGTALKPAYEDIIVAMKPLDGTFAANAETWGVAGLNIDGGRIGCEDTRNYRKGHFKGNISQSRNPSSFDTKKPLTPPHPQGRWPANLILDESMDGEWTRYFYCAKASRAERNAGLEGMEEKQKIYNGQSQSSSKEMKDLEERWTTKPTQNHHPTVKPLKLMQYLCRLLKPPQGGILLDPFCGSGTTLMAAVSEGWDYLGIDREWEYVEIAEKRVAWMKQQQGQQGLFE